MKTKLLLCFAFILNFCTAIAAAGQQLPFDLRQGSSDETVFRMSDRQIGWSRGTNSVLRTTDGGSSWQTVLLTASREPVGSFFYGPNTAWVAVGVIDDATNVTIFRTTDGGKTWQGTELRERIPIIDCQFSFPSRTNGWLMVIPEHGMSSAPGTLYRTADAGKTWQQVTSGQWFDEAASLAEKSKYAKPGLPFGGAILFQEDSVGWLIGSFANTVPAYLLSTRDGGANWSEQTLAYPASLGPGRMAPTGLPHFFPRDGKSGLVEGNFVPNDPESTNRVSIIYHSRDRGATWQAGPTTFTMNSSFSFFSATDGYLWKDESLWNSRPAKGTLYRTRDAGVSWTEVKPQKSLAEALARGLRVVQLEFVDDECGWAVALSNTLQGRLLQTVDGGKNWIELPTRIAHPLLD